MILLTDKAKIDFEKWYIKDCSEWTKVFNLNLFYDKPSIEKSSYYIDWFDTIDRINFQELYMNEFRDNYLMYPILSIQAETIKKANEIYNKICPSCNGKGLVEGEEYDDVQSCLTCNGSGKLC